VLASIYLNNKPLFKAKEVNNVRAYRVLPAKPLPTNLTLAKMPPQDSLGIS
jgi:hypothetical protein